MADTPQPPPKDVEGSGETQPSTPTNTDTQEHQATSVSEPVTPPTPISRPAPTLPPPPPPPPAPVSRGHVRPQAGSKGYLLSGRRGRKPKPKRPPLDRRDSGLYLPVWSVALTLMFVLAIAFGIVFVIYSLGGQNPPGGAPRIVIITAIPSAMPTPNPFAVPTSMFLENQGGQNPAPTVALEGPTLEPVFLSPTPTPAASISVGDTVAVRNVGTSGLRGRTSPGLVSSVEFIAEENQEFKVIEGPQRADNLTWWRVQNPDDPSEAGWVAESDGVTVYLEVVLES